MPAGFAGPRQGCLRIDAVGIKPRTYDVLFSREVAPGHKAMVALCIGLDHLQAAETDLEMHRRALFRRCCPDEIAGDLASKPACETRIHKERVIQPNGGVDWFLTGRTCLPLTQTEVRFRFGDCALCRQWAQRPSAGDTDGWIRRAPGQLKCERCGSQNALLG